MKPDTWFSAGRNLSLQFLHLCRGSWCFWGKTLFLLVLNLLATYNVQAFSGANYTCYLFPDLSLLQDEATSVLQTNQALSVASGDFLWLDTYNFATFKLITAIVGGSTGSLLATSLWLTDWLYGCCIIGLLMLIVIGLVHLRTRRLMYMQRMLEQIVSERTKEILEQKEEIEIQRDDIKQKHLQLLQARQIILKQNKELKDANARLTQEVKERTRDLRHANKDLMLTSQELDELIYKASHDIRGPLARMIGVCNLAMIDLTDPQAKEYLTLLRKEAVNTTEILSKLLSISHLKKNAINSDSVSLADMVRQSVYSLKNMENFHMINFDLQVPESISLRTDSGLLKIILTNLLENAAMYANQLEPVIQVRAAVCEDRIMISVKDNGAGIPEDIAPRIFERYFRGTEKSKGAGLGLYTASTAAKKLRGSLKLSHSTGSETEFIIALPISVLETKLAQLVA